MNGIYKQKKWPFTLRCPVGYITILEKKKIFFVHLMATIRAIANGSTICVCVTMGRLYRV